MTREPAPLPVIRDPGVHKQSPGNGPVLEVWIDRWGFDFAPIDWKIYSLALNAKARLSQDNDGQVLWDFGDCAYAGSGYDDRIALADFKSSDRRNVQAKIRQTVSRVRQ